MSARILVACATKYGSTYEIGEFIGEELKKSGFSADVYAAGDVKSLSGYDLIIIGSPVYAEKWLPEALDMIKRNREEFTGKKTALFSAGLTMKDDTPENREKLKEASAEAKNILSPVSEEFFAGKMDYKKLSIPHKIMVKAVKAPEGDFRNWRRIREWTVSLTKYL